MTRADASRKRFAMIGLLTLLWPAFAGADDLGKQGDELFRAGHFAKAEQAYAKAVAADANDYQAVLRLGEIALLGNRFTDAEKHLRQAMNLRPNEERPRELLAEVYYRQDRFQPAADLLRKAGAPAAADKLASFKGLTPYEVVAKTDTTRLEFVQTDPLPIIRARFHGSEEGLLIVDTGASELYLDTAFADKLGVPRFGSTTGMYAGGKTAAVEHGRLDSIQLGEFEIRNVPVIVKERRAAFRAPGGEPPVGVIGTVVFYHFLTTLDYPNGELVLRRKTDAVRAGVDRLAESPETHVVPFWMAGQHFMVAWGTVNESKPFLMFADTGLAGGGFLCPESTLEEANIDISDLPCFQGMGGGGPVTVTPFKTKRLALGTATEHNVTGFFGGFPPDSEYGRGFRIGGIISHAFFRPYALTFDFEKMRFLLTPSK